MKGDFSRFTFNPEKHYSGVLMQQGRVQLDSDWNEQTCIYRNYLQTVVCDLIGPHGAPNDTLDRPGFEVSNLAKDNDFTITAGRYYVQGVLCRSRGTTYKTQLGFPFPDSDDIENNNPYLVYLDIWERQITCLEDPGLIEPALGGPDTTTRIQVVSQVKVLKYKLREGDPERLRTDYVHFLGAHTEIMKPGSAKIKVFAGKVAQQDRLASSFKSNSQYQGLENHLYRIEVHRGGRIEDGPTFKWSRENGCVVFPIHEICEGAVTIEIWRQDKKWDLNEGDWVEILDVDNELRLSPGRMAQVKRVERFDMVKLKVILKEASNLPVYDSNLAKIKHALLRRWDHKAGAGLKIDKGAILIQEGDDSWLNLEDGVQVQFSNGSYRTGDYWLIPARTATGDIEWPLDQTGQPQALSPHGIEHWYAPIAIIQSDKSIIDLRRIFDQPSLCVDKKGKD
jgi:hypothetical protein